MENNLHSNEQSDDESSKSSDQSLCEEWAPHACSYCGYSHKSSVVQCLNKNCCKWFCNEKVQSGFTSHIVYHLVKSTHNEIGVHSEGDLGDLAIQCFICGSMNVFVLGYVSVKQGNSPSLILICRAPCVGEKKANGYEWDQNSWQPIIQQKALISWIAQRSSESQKRFDVPLQDMVKLEDAWKINPKLKYADIIKKKIGKKLKPVLLKYKSGKQYKSVFQSLLAQQSKSDKSVKDSQTQNDIRVNFNQINDKLYANFMFGGRQDYDTCLVTGNQLNISYKNQWSSKGLVVRITGNQQICLELSNNENVPKIDYPYKVQLVWKPTSYQRMKKGLRKFENDHNSISSYLYHSILGQPWQKSKLNIKIPSNLSTPGLPKLNFYQQQAIRKALTEPLCLIQGPPGTGKTVTSASIVYHLVKITKKPILVCAPSNVVVDMLAQRIHQTGVKVLRFCSKSRQSVSSDVEQLTLHYQLRQTNDAYFDKLKENLVKNNDKMPNNGEEHKMKKKSKKRQNEILQSADVICATCIASADHRLNDCFFNHVLIDEATQAIQPESILPMLKSAKQVILVGDHLQLGPVVICRQTAKAGLNKSLFERLVMIGHKPIRLQVQYRMHPSLTTFPSNTFYDGTLQNGIMERDRIINKQFPWPHNKPTFFLNTYGTEELSASGTSYLNRTEAVAVEKIIFYLERAGINAKQIGVITPYKGQRAYIINYLLKNGQLSSKNPNYYKNIQIASVDGYQGRQKDYIIVSCVRSNQSPNIGFLKDPRRLNVTITRSKYGMIIIGNAKVLYQNNLWNNLLNEYKKADTLVQGTIPNFRSTLLNFPPSLKYNTERKAVYTNNGDDDDQPECQDEHIKSQASLGFLDQMPITSGHRFSALGYTDIPQVAAFSKDKLFEIFSSKNQNSTPSQFKNIKMQDLDLE